MNRIEIRFLGPNLKHFEQKYNSQFKQFSVMICDKEIKVKSCNVKVDVENFYIQGIITMTNGDIIKFDDDMGDDVIFVNEEEFTFNANFILDDIENIYKKYIYKKLNL